MEGGLLSGSRSVQRREESVPCPSKFQSTRVQGRYLEFGVSFFLPKGVITCLLRYSQRGACLLEVRGVQNIHSLGDQTPPLAVTSGTKIFTGFFHVYLLCSNRVMSPFRYLKRVRQILKMDSSGEKKARCLSLLATTSDAFCC